MYRIISTWWNRSLHFLHLPVGPHGFYFLLKFHVFIFWLCWVFVVHQLFSSRSARASHCRGFLCCGAQTLERQDFSSRAAQAESVGLVVVALGLSCSTACGIFLDQVSNPCLLVGRWILYHWATREAPALMDSWLRSQFQWQKKI